MLPLWIKTPLRAFDLTAEKNDGLFAGSTRTFPREADPLNPVFSHCPHRLMLGRHGHSLGDGAILKFDDLD
jgi:hypothetical protein